ncbi:MAG: peptidoglycan DD-metalloendopeptidase family protein [Bacteroidetes bacterium]|nr:peptidoglycan DD-metalloendopeptidase family protein [Bacteroidota bacterium]
MKKIKYYYNTNTLRYEKLVTPFRVKLLRFFTFMAVAIFTSFIIVFFAFRFIPSPQLKIAEMKYQKMRENYDVLSSQAQALQQEMGLLEKRDNQVYRSIFEANPLPDSMRAKLYEQDKEIKKVAAINDEQLGNELASTLNNLQARIKYQYASYNEIEGLIKNQSEKLASLPAIQPVSNRDLDRIASGFGMRIDPVYGTPKMHKGLDFTAPQGTPIYATGDGVVEMAGYDQSGYGNHVIINNGYGYETLFGHMVRVKVHAGEKVKRGEVIGWVGSTGKSTGPHCHYEVHVNGREVDPVYFFYNDLNAEQFDRILKIASKGSAKSLD